MMVYGPFSMSTVMPCPYCLVTMCHERVGSIQGVHLSQQMVLLGKNPLVLCVMLALIQVIYSLVPVV